MSTEAFRQHHLQSRSKIDTALEQYVREGQWPDSLRRAIEYSLLANGKRFRPALVLMAADVCGADTDTAMPAACAIEMVHTYSLIHDDLPSMDDDDYRRGRPTSHNVFGEALAVLAGDALLTHAFETLATGLPTDTVPECIRILAQAAGGAGMVGGQVLDLEGERGTFCPPKTLEFLQSQQTGGDDDTTNPVQETTGTGERRKAASDGRPIRVEQLIQIHRMKTGALITAALEMGAVVSGASSEDRIRLRRYGEATGLAFQITDDLLDVTGNNDRLGKETGRDHELGKLTYPSLIGIEESQRRAADLVEEAIAAVSAFGERATPLRQLAQFIVERDH